MEQFFPNHPDLCLMSPQKVRFAVLASLARLQSLGDGEPSESNIQKIPTLPLVGSLYLWTFTTPSKVSLERISFLWSRFMQRKMMRSIPWQGMNFKEPHPGGHGWHVHAVAVRRYNVRTIRTLATTSGFGRIHVKEIPASRAWYVLKYVTKASFNRTAEEKSKQLWGCNGFRGYPASKVVVQDTFLHEAIAHFGYIPAQKEKLAYIWSTFIKHWSSQTRLGETKIKITMNEIQTKKSVELVSAGSRIQFVEYRGTKVRSVRKFVDGHPHPTEKQYYAVHLLESNASPILLEEALEDSFRPDDKIVPPAKKGQTAVLEITKTVIFNGKETLSGKLHAIG